MDLAELGKTFHEARIRSRQTQQDVANATRISVKLISLFENGMLSDLGGVRLLALFEQVGLELVPRPIGQRRTLADVANELNQAEQISQDVHPARQRVRSKKARTD